MQRRLLTGTYECSLDDRFRLAIPAKLRGPFLEGGAMVGWWIDECLVVVPGDDWAPLVDSTFGTMSVLDDEARELSRFILAGAFHHELDKQGRVPLTAELREHAGIGDSKVRLIGAGGYLEIWDPSRIADRFAKLRREGVSHHAKRLAPRVA